MGSQAEAYSTSTASVVQYGAWLTVPLWKFSLPQRRIRSRTTRTKPVNWCNDEHAIHRQVNGRTSERRAKRHALEDELARANPTGHTQAAISGVVRTHGRGKHCCRFAGGRALLRMPRGGH